MLCKTAWLPKFISSKRRGCPYLKASRKWPSYDDIPSKEFLSPTIFPGTVSDDILNLIRGFLVLATRQANSVEKVLEVPDDPSNRTGTPLDIL